MPSLIKDFPKDVRKAVLLKQVDLKENKQNKFKTSQRQAIIEIIEEWLELKKPKPTS